MRVCWILIGRFWNCRNFLKNDANNMKLILVVYHWNVFWMVSKVILYHTHVRVCARALLFRHFSDTTMAITFELKTEINSNFYCRFITWMPKEWCQEKLSWSKSRARECACIVISDVYIVLLLYEIFAFEMNSFEMYISDMYWASLLIGYVKIIIPHAPHVRWNLIGWYSYVHISLFNEAFGMKFGS